MTAVEPTGEPWPHPWPVNEHCYSHNAHEPIPRDLPGGVYTVCGECMHVFVTAEELVQAYIDNEPEPKGPVPDAGSIYFCPHCAHDF